MSAEIIITQLTDRLMMESNGAGAVRSSRQIHFELSPPFFSRLPPSPPLLIIHSPSSICLLYPRGGCGFYVCSSYHSQLASNRDITLQRPQLSSHVRSWVSALASFSLKGHPCICTRIPPVTPQVNGDSRQVQIRIRIQILHSTTAGFTSLMPTSFMPPRFWV